MLGDSSEDVFDSKTDKFTWQSMAAAGKQLIHSKPLNAQVLYLTAIAECRQSLGPNASRLADLFEDMAQVCTNLDRATEAKQYQAKAEQIRVFNRPKAQELTMIGII